MNAIRHIKFSGQHSHAAASYNQRPNEAPLQAYVRHLHEVSNRFALGDEPVRGKDPWNGIGL